MHNILKKFLFTIGLLMLSRLGMFIPLPGIDYESFYCINRNNSAFQNLTTLSGHGLTFIGFSSLGIVPYINASLLIQVVIKMIPLLKNIQKEEGESGRRKVVKATRHLALIWSIIQSFGLSLWLEPYALNPNPLFKLETTLALSAGFMLNLWISEQITEKGIGTGPSMFVFVSIVSYIPSALTQKAAHSAKTIYLLKNIIVWLLLIPLTMGIILVHGGVRKIPLISTKQLMKNKTNIDINYIPIKINHVGVTPIILASSLLKLVTSLKLPKNNTVSQHTTNILLLIRNHESIFSVIYFLLVICLSYFYGLTNIKPNDIAKDLQRLETTIRGVKSEKKTAIYLQRTLRNISLLGAILLAFTATAPLAIDIMLGMTALQNLGAGPLLILIGIILETHERIEVQLKLENYPKLIN